jgi:hypothetical protein
MKCRPFSGSTVPLWPARDLSRNQYATIDERQPINQVPPLDFFPGSGRENGTVTVTGLSSIGAATTLPFNIVQNRFKYADQMYLTRGAHTLTFGASVTRTQDNVFAPFEIGGVYTFNSLQDFLQGIAYTLVGALPSAGDATRDFRELLFAPYFNDQWKIRPNLL